MAEFLQYVLNEMKQHRLAKAEALDLLRQFHGNVLEELNGELSTARSYPDNAVAGHQVQRLSPEAEPAVSPLASAKPGGITLRPLSETLLPGIADEGHSRAAAGTATAEKLREELAVSLAGVLDMLPGDVDAEEPFTQFGLDSISGVEWVRDLHNRFGVPVTLEDIHANASLRELSVWLASAVNAEAAAVPAEQFPTVTLPIYEPVEEVHATAQAAPIKLPERSEPAGQAASSRPLFPELIALNHRTSGRPVFWIHGGSAIVSGYKPIAQEAERPMYGIQARGWMSSRKPLHGIQAMAAYYVHIIMSVQPHGPYDLGGFSLGGRIAYEVARQLQELGEGVQTIVMLDSYLHTPYREALQDEAFYRKTIALQAVNSALLSALSPEPKSWAGRLIHQDEARAYLHEDPELFLEQLLEMASARGLNGSEAAWRERLEQSIRVQEAYGLDRYVIAPLDAPEEPSCYYFRCRGGSFYGELEPYFCLDDNGTGPADAIPYWKAWEEWLPHMSVMTAGSDSHYRMLSDLRAMEAVRTFCRMLYRMEGPPAEAIAALIEENQIQRANH